MTKPTEAEHALQAQVHALKAELAALRGDPAEGRAWLQAKCASQRSALDALNRRVTSQRMALRRIEELGRGLTHEEYLAARAASPQPDRILEKV